MRRNTLGGSETYIQEEISSLMGGIRVDNFVFVEEVDDETTQGWCEMDEELCLCCLTPIRPAANFCGSCGGPTGFLAATIPFQQVFAEGFVYHRAIQRPQSLMSVLGIWVLFLGEIVLGGLYAHASWVWWPVYEGFFERLFLVENIVGSGLIALGVGAIWQSTVNYLERDRVSIEEVY